MAFDSFTTSMINMSALNKAYQGAMADSSQYYAAAMNAYTQARNQQRAAQARIEKGYDSLMSNVMSTISQVGAGQAQDIKQNYATQTGNLTQNMISSGLGNTTVVGSMQRGVEYDRAKAGNDLAGKIADVRANYQNQIGQGKLGFMNSAMNQGTALWVNQAGAIGGFSGQRGGLSSTYMNNLSHIMSQAHGTGNGPGGYNVSGGNPGHIPSASISQYGQPPVPPGTDYFGNPVASGFRSTAADRSNYTSGGAASGVPQGGGGSPQYFPIGLSAAFNSNNYGSGDWGEQQGDWGGGEGGWGYQQGDWGDQYDA